MSELAPVKMVPSSKKPCISPTLVAPKKAVIVCWIVVILVLYHAYRVEKLYWSFNDEFDLRASEKWPWMRVFSAWIGWVAGYLIVFQFVTGTRFKFLDRLIGLDRMWIVHRWCSILAIICTLLHAYLRGLGSTARENSTFKELTYYVFEFNYRFDEWPPIVFSRNRGDYGRHALWWMIILTVISFLRKLPANQKSRPNGKQKGFIPWGIWRTLHIGFILVIGLVIWHVRVVGNPGSSDVVERFNEEHTAPGQRAAALDHFPYLFRRSSIMDMMQGRRGKTFIVRKTEAISERITRVLLDPADGTAEACKYDAASFVIINRPEQSIFKQTPHPFSLASKPNDTCHELIIAGARIGSEAADWIPGTFVKVDGYYGRFAADMLACRHITLIAGGAGMAPIISQLRYLADLAESNRGQEQPRVLPSLGLILGARNIDELSPSFEVVEQLVELSKENLIQFTPRLLIDKDDKDTTRTIPKSLQDSVRVGYINRSDVELTTDVKARVYVCGPSVMVKAAKSFLTTIGIKKRDIIHENFVM
ncbi:hypothetical protein GEMRC1_002950 [Eukaryota sp. GEM-RC1]